MKKNIQLLFTLLLINNTLVSFPVHAQQKALVNFVQSKNLKYASIGIKIMNVSTGAIICEYNENQSLCPASCMKLLTTASALEILGDDFIFQTTIFTDGTIDTQGNLKGNIYIKGVGDPTLGSEYTGVNPNNFLDEWLNGIRKAGIKSISGSVIALDNLFGYEGVSPKWTWEDLGNYYASGSYGISIFDNMYRLYLKSETVGTVPEILKTEPFIPSLTFENNLKAAENNIDSAYIYGMPFSNNRRIYGTIPQNKPSFVIKGDIPDPGLFLSEYLTTYLQKNNISVSKKASSFRLIKNNVKQSKQLATHISPTLSDIIQIVNFRSNNHYAEHLFRKIQFPENQQKNIKKYWKNKDFQTDGLFMYDGSGLSPSNGITAGFLTELLIYMNNRSKYADTFYHSLPIAGKEGSVVSFLKNTSLDGNVRAKSGSMENVLSYSGYIDKNGKRYAFTIIINKYMGSRNEIKTQIEQLLVRLFDNSKANI